MGTIISTGAYIPPKRVHNDELSTYFETSHEWIFQRTGIVSRHLSEGENTSDLATKAAKQALERAGITPEQIGFIIVATMSPDYISPSTACIVQGQLGAKQAFAFDINAACSGFTYALSVGEQLMQSGIYNYGLVIGAETMSKILDWSNRNSTVLFGDGAGCVLLGKSDSSLMQTMHLGSDGSKHLCLTACPFPVKNPIHDEALSVPSFLTMDGREIFNFATRKVPQLIEAALQEANLSEEAIDYYLCHQANARMIEIIAKKVKQPLDKFPMNLAEYGNTSAASIPILLNEMVEQKTITLTQSQNVMLIGFGGGLTWGTLIIKL